MLRVDGGVDGQEYFCIKIALAKQANGADSDRTKGNHPKRGWWWGWGWGCQECWLTVEGLGWRTLPLPGRELVAIPILNCVWVATMGQGK